MQGPCRGLRELGDPAVERDLKQLDVRADLGGVEDRLSVRRPNRHVAAAAVEVGDVEEFDHAPIAATVGQFLQSRAVSTDDVRMAVVVLAADEQHPLPVRRPSRRKVERVAGLHVQCVRAIGIRQIHLIALVIGNPPAVARTAEAVGELLRVLCQIDFVPAVAIHAKRVRVAVDQGCEAQFRRLVRPEEQPAVVEADALDRGDVRRLGRWPDPRDTNRAASRPA